MIYYDEVNRKKKAAGYFVFAVIALAGIYLARLLQLFQPLYSRIYYGNLNKVFYSGLCVIFWIAFAITFYHAAKKFLGFKFKKAHPPLSLSRTAIIYAIAILAIFLVSASLNFQIKVVYELGERITGMQLLGNGVSYLAGAMQLLISLMAMALVQEGMELIMPPCKVAIPYGAAIITVTYGLIEYILGSGGEFAMLYLSFNLLYGFIYTLSRKNFGVSYWICLIVYIL